MKEKAKKKKRKQMLQTQEKERALNTTNEEKHTDGGRRKMYTYQTLWKTGSRTDGRRRHHSRGKGETITR